MIIYYILRIFTIFNKKQFLNLILNEFFNLNSLKLVLALDLAWVDQNYVDPTKKYSRPASTSYRPWSTRALSTIDLIRPDSTRPSTLVDPTGLDHRPDSTKLDPN